MSPQPKEVFDKPEIFVNFLCSPEFEGQFFDRKEVKGGLDKNVKDVANGITECVSSFANSNIGGGLVVVGISNDGDLIGINHLSETQINTGLLGVLSNLRFHATATREFTVEGKKLLLLYTAFTQDGICETSEANAKSYKRQGIQCVQLTDIDKEQIKRDKRIVNFESQHCEVFNEDYLDQDVVQEFKRAYLSERDTKREYTTEEILLNAGALGKDQSGNLYFTKAGYLFFAANPRRVLGGAFIRLLRFSSSYDNYLNPGAANFDKDIDGPLPEIIRKIRVFFKESAYFKTYTYRKPEGGFSEEPEYPTIAVDEGIVNAVIHRDYASNAPIRCLTYNDALVIENPGSILQESHKVPKEFSLQDEILESYPRNPKLVEWLRLLKDTDGRAFVRALSEGTKTMNEEMRKLNLPSPQYHTLGKTYLRLFNNVIEREKKFSLDPERLASEFGNLFKLDTIQDIGKSIIDFNLLKKELLSVIKDGLLLHNWYIDKASFGRLIVHQRGDAYRTTDAVNEICRIYRAYILQIRAIGSQLYLLIDYKVELKNVLSLDRLIKLKFLQLEGRSVMARMENKWYKGKLTGSLSEVESEVFLSDFEQSYTITNSDVIPNLGKMEISKILLKKEVRYDLDIKIKELALASQVNSTKIRADYTLGIADLLSRQLNSLKYKGMTFHIHSKPQYLFESNERSLSSPVKPLTVFHDIPEPLVEFNSQHKDSDILNGLTRFGAYSHQEQTIEIIPMCLISERSSMQNLINRLVTGKYKFQGVERTFGVKFIYNTIYTVDQYTQLLPECKRLIESNHNWKGNQNTDGTLPRIFLVSIPEKAFDIADIESPYFSIKEYLFEVGIPCQMLDAPILNNPDFKDLNLTLNLTSKCGRKPWVLPDKLPDADFFIGLSYTTNSESFNQEKYMGFANVFDPYGKWQFYKGNTKVFDFNQRHIYFRELIRETLNDLPLNETPSLHFHYSAKFSKEDIAVILEAAKEIKPKGQFSFVWINDSHIVRLYDSSAHTNGSLARGSYVVTSRNQFYLSTTGNNAYKKSMGTPKMLEVNVREVGKLKSDAIDYRLYASQILSLTKLNWASTQALCGEPITIKYAREIAYLTEKFIRRRGKFVLHPALERTPWFV